MIRALERVLKHDIKAWLMGRGSQGGGFTGEGGADFVETNVTKLILAISHI